MGPHLICITCTTPAVDSTTWKAAVCRRGPHTDMVRATGFVWTSEGPRKAVRTAARLRHSWLFAEPPWGKRPGRCALREHQPYRRAPGRRWTPSPSCGSAPHASSSAVAAMLSGCTPSRAISASCSIASRGLPDRPSCASQPFECLGCRKMPSCCLTLQAAWVHRARGSSLRTWVILLVVLYSDGSGPFRFCGCRAGADLSCNAN